jgi:ankyrin repeat protein
LAALLVLVGCTKESTNIAQAVDGNEAGYVKEWLKSGGDPNLTNAHGESLLYIATGPHGGHEVLEALLAAGAKIEMGAGKYTPLMNAASWCDLEAVQLLLKHGANPNAQNERGQRALDVVGRGGGAEEPVIDLLRSVTRANR